MGKGGVGQAVRAARNGNDYVRLRFRQVYPRKPAAHDREVQDHDVLRAADDVPDAHPRRPQ